MTKREILVEMGYEDSIVFENPDYDNAIIGVSEENRVIYDYDLMIECLMKEDGMSAEEAADFISYNTIRSLGYHQGEVPIVMFRIWDEYGGDSKDESDNTPKDLE